MNGCSLHDSVNEHGDSVVSVQCLRHLCFSKNAKPVALPIKMDRPVKMSRMP